MARVAATKVQVSRMVALANGKQFSNISLLDISFGISKKPESNCQNLQQFQRAGKGNLKGNGNIFFIFSFERTFKTITLLPFFRLLLTSTNNLIERNEMSAIFIFCRYAFHVTTQHNTTQHNTTQHNTTQHNTTQHNRVTQYFYLDNHFALKTLLCLAHRNIKITQNL